MNQYTRFCIDDVDRIVADIGGREENVVAILQAIQGRYRYLADPALHRVCEVSDITPARVESVATFFAQFRRRPVGKHVISVCDGTACHVKGAPAIHEAILLQLRLSNGEDTDADGVFTLQKVACLGCCTLAPAVQIDSTTYGHVRPDTVSKMLEDFLEQAARGAERSPGRPSPTDAAGEIRVGLGSCCIAGGSEKVRRALERSLAAIESDVRVKHVSCVGMCHQTPLLEILVPGAPARLYAKVQAEDVGGIVARHFKARRPVARIRAAVSRWLEDAYTDEGRAAPQRCIIDPQDPPVAAFLRAQRRIATEYCGEIDPIDIDEYQRLDGFQALRRCLFGEAGEPPPTPEQVIDEIRRSGLRGRGGAGFPTARKWQSVREAHSDRKVVICNADEGDPGAFMDRMTLESFPYRVIEGMIVAAVTVGAGEAIMYVRSEYPLAIARVKQAIEACVRAGILGDDILGSGQVLRLRVVEAAGAFVCGEETALIASVEGRRGTPKYRPPYPAQAGLYGCPTLVNNTETFAFLPWILRHGADAFAALGTEKSKGTKVFSLAGRVRRGGLIEVPMGTTIREIVDDIGGGISGGAEFKAVQVGGPSGGCVPAALGDTPVDYEALTSVGAMMGSGGFVVLDEGDCMVEMAQYFLSFTQRESCGKCTPCRVGTKRMLEILEGLCEGRGAPEDLERLERLARVAQTYSLCGLGKTAPNPVLTTLRYFREEYEAHVEGRCPAGKCKRLITYSITDDCIGCTKCAQACPSGAIEMKPYQRHEIDVSKCTRCDGCRQACTVDAVHVE